MIPKSCKRLAEVDFPIAVVSKHSVKEKKTRHGHPSTLHLWWARRPLAACRAMLLGLLLPDPCDEHCPEDFKAEARALLPQVTGNVGPGDMDLRRALLRFIGDFANWDRSADRTFLAVGRGLVKAAHGEEPPLVVDPFAGGGSIPLEALRLGCEAFASDLNPVACLILKVMLEDIPRHGPGLADELRRAGAEIKAVAEKELAEFYPPDPDGAHPIAYLWARTVRCEAPNCGAEIPLVRSFWLSKKANRKWALRYKVARPEGKTPHIEFEIFEPKSEKEVPPGTVSRAKATCPCCNIVLPPERVRAQLSAQRGGADTIFDSDENRAGGAYLLAVITSKASKQDRNYRLSNERDYKIVKEAWKWVKEILVEWENNGKKGLCPLPDEPLRRVPVPFGVINVWVYGVTTWRELFASRQLLTLHILSETIKKVSVGHSQTIYLLLTLALGLYARCCNGNARMRPDSSVAPAFGMQALPFTWAFPETVPWGDRSEHYNGAIETISNILDQGGLPLGKKAQIEQADAKLSPMPDAAIDVWFTDPPYYDAIPYSYLSDFFYVWQKRCLNNLLPKLYDSQLTPKTDEIVCYSYEHVHEGVNPRTRFENMFAQACSEGRRILRDDAIGSIVFAHKTTDGWEALLSGLVSTGWTVTGSWPLATEATNRLRARDSAALATSVHLVCRPRPEDAPVGDWMGVFRELQRRVADWMERLQGEGVRGADLVFACIGPALEVYSRFSKVVDAEDREIPLGGDPEAREPHLRGYLAYVWETVGRAALEQVLGTEEARARNGAAGVLEEDARLTALFLWTLQSTDGEADSNETEAEEDAEADEADEEEEGGVPRKKKAKGFSLPFDVVRRFAQPLGIHLPEWEERIIQTEKGVVRLLGVADRAEGLFGREGAQAIADRIEKSPQGTLQLTLFSASEETAAPKVRGRGRRKRAASGGQVSDEALETRREATTLDRVHAALLLQKMGRTNALRALLKAEQDRGPDFIRLSNSLSALYPRGSEERRLLEAMLQAVPR